VTRYRCGDAQEADGFPVTAACDAAGVSASEYYAWAARRAGSPAERDEANLVEAIQDV
jgi:hypothetical protein